MSLLILVGGLAMLVSRSYRVAQGMVGHPVAGHPKMGSVASLVAEEPTRLRDRLTSRVPVRFKETK